MLLAVPDDGYISLARTFHPVSSSIALAFVGSGVGLETSIPKAARMNPLPTRVEIDNAANPLVSAMTSSQAATRMSVIRLPTLYTKYSASI